ncbi:MAG: L,D-transpeptidase [Deltaproteobacteria bacterium]|nr:L,D-transpeptidase [Deltaproteobacteria bacterium]
MRRTTTAIIPALLVLLLGAGAARAFDPPPWTDPGDLPLPSDAMSVVATQDDIPIESAPTAGGRRRGTLAQGVPMPLFAIKRGPGCNGRWFAVGPLAWVCQDHMRFTTDAPVAARDAALLNVQDGLPFRYYFVGRGGSSGYFQLNSADQSSPDQDLEAGFAVAVVEQRKQNGETYGRSHHGLWIPMRDLVPVRPKTFRGEVVTEGKLDFGWVMRDDARGLAKPVPGSPPTDRRFARFQRVPIVEEQTVRKDRYLRIDDKSWLHERDVRKPSLAAPPSEVAKGERWVDVELATQTIVAYEGDRPVYATLVSTGKGPQGSAFATPKGVHRIWVKLIGSNMDNLEDEEASNYYSIEDVPWVQYFSNGVGLHGVFWHNDFGRVRSHGCVNLTPLDAQWFFSFTGPHVPAGWTAVLPTELDPGTVIRVR